MTHPRTSSTAGGRAVKRARRSDDSVPIAVDRRAVERLELVVADHFVIVEVERPERSGDGGEFGPGELAVLIAVELIEERIGAADRLPPDLESERTQDRAEGLGQFVDRDDAVFGVDVQLSSERGRGRAGRQPHERGESVRVGLLGRERAVTVAVEAGVEHPDGIDPRRLERPIAWT